MSFCNRFSDIVTIFHKFALIKISDKLIDLVVRFLEQGNGKFSERAKNKELNALTENEAAQIEGRYKEIFG